MIKVTEIDTIKCPGMTSFTVEIGYNPELFKKLLSIENAIYHKRLKKLEFPVSSLSKLVDLTSQYDDVTITFLKEKEENQHVFPSVKHKTKPYQYQLDGIEFGLNHDRFLLLDAPGLGKSLQAIYLAEELHNLGKVNHCLVICGINTLKTNWQKEIQRHSTLPSLLIGQKISRTGNSSVQGIQYRINQLSQKINEFFVILNVESLRSDELVKTLKDGPNKYDMIVFDEMHTCFDYHTIVRTDLGDFKIGDIVEQNIACRALSKNENGKYEYKEIVDRHKKFSVNNIKLYFDNGEVLDCTEDHLIFTLNRGWVPAKDLTPKDVVDVVL